MGWMTRSSSVAFRGRRDGFFGAGLLGVLLGASGLFATSCLTPEFSFGPDPADGVDGREPSCTDRVENGDESDVDCGGGDCPRCLLGQRCVVPSDCEQPTEGSSATVVCNDEDKCAIQCARGTADCNQSALDGCEIDTQTDGDNCGACDVVCGGSASANLESASCADGACVVACEPGWCSEAGSPELACNGRLGTTAHCRTCDEVCPADQPFCDAETGCRATLRIELVNAGTMVTSETGTTNDGTLILTHNLETSRAQNERRAVLLVIGSLSNPQALPTPTYAGKDMKVGVAQHSANLAGGGIYYLLDADLPANAGEKNVLVPSPNPSDPTRWMVQVIELVNVSSSASVLSAAKFSGGAGSCASLNTSIEAVPPGSWVFSTVTLARIETTSITPLSEQIVFDGQELGGSNPGLRVGGYLPDVSGDTSMNWNCANSDRWVHLLAAFSPEGTRVPETPRRQVD